MQKQSFAIKTKFQAASLENKALNGSTREFSTKEALKARSKFDNLKNSVEKLLSARSQNKQNIESKVSLRILQSLSSEHPTHIYIPITFTSLD